MLKKKLSNHICRCMLCVCLYHADTYKMVSGKMKPSCLFSTWCSSIACIACKANDTTTWEFANVCKHSYKRFFRNMFQSSKKTTWNNKSRYWYFILFVLAKHFLLNVYILSPLVFIRAPISMRRSQEEISGFRFTIPLIKDSQS